jgi:L-threonylcarbamoyladenylate synthase
VNVGPERLDVRVLEPSGLERAVAHVRAGGLLAYPTETVYGFGGSLASDAVAAVLALKGRGVTRPVLLLVASPADAPGLLWSEEARELARVFWPGALTLILADPGQRYPPGVRSPSGGVGVRRCAHAVPMRLVEALGAPVTSTSANVPGEAPARSGDEAAEVAARLGVGPDMLVLDAGQLPESPPSTVVDCAGATARVVREGAIPISRLRCVLPELHVVA